MADLLTEKQESLLRGEDVALLNDTSPPPSRSGSLATCGGG